MFIMDETTGDMTTRQGDSFSFRVEGISDEWKMYFSVYEIKTRRILFEISTFPVNEVTTFNVSPANSNLMTVPQGKKSELYYYGIKRCKDGVEDTLIVGNKDIPDLNKILVYPLTNEGDENGAS